VHIENKVLLSKVSIFHELEVRHFILFFPRNYRFHRSDRFTDDARQLDFLDLVDVGPAGSRIEGWDERLKFHKSIKNVEKFYVLKF